MDIVNLSLSSEDVPDDYKKTVLILLPNKF